jgi:hypothetical protein
MGHRHCASTLGTGIEPKFVVFRAQPSRQLREFPSTGLVYDTEREIPGRSHVEE